MDGEFFMKRRWGRRKNVEGFDLFFMSYKWMLLSVEDVEVIKVFEEDIEILLIRNIFFFG